MNTNRISLLLILVLLCSSVNVSAGDGWLESGKNLLNGLLGSKPASQLSLNEIGSGLKEALRVGTDRVVTRLRKKNGFYKDPAIHIPLPEKLEKVKKTLDRFGMGASLDNLELKMNRAAEAATPRAKKIFWNTISHMTIDDVRGIYNGPDDAATRYLQAKMSKPLREAMRPVINNSLSRVGAIQAYDKVMAKYKTIPFVPDIKANLTNDVLNKALAGIFHYLAIEEAAIRKDPAKRTTELLRKVFGK